MTLRELVMRNRSYRRFDEKHAVNRETLMELVDLARMTASAANRQPLKYLLSADSETNACIFPTLAWAAYLKDWPGPAEGERPTAYIVVLLDTTISDNLLCDDGIAAQTILLGAVEKGLGGCIVASVRRDTLREALNIPEALAIRFVIALGKPAETVVLEELPPSGDIRYWRDDLGRHHVPKRSLKDLIVA